MISFKKLKVKKKVNTRAVYINIIDCLSTSKKKKKQLILLVSCDFVNWVYTHTASPVHAYHVTCYFFYTILRKISIFLRGKFLAIDTRYTLYSNKINWKFRLKASRFRANEQIQREKASSTFHNMSLTLSKQLFIYVLPHLSSKAPSV